MRAAPRLPVGKLLVSGYGVHHSTLLWQRCCRERFSQLHLFQLYSSEMWLPYGSPPMACCLVGWSVGRSVIILKEQGSYIANASIGTLDMYICRKDKIHIFFLNWIKERFRVLTPIFLKRSISSPMSIGGIYRVFQNMVLFFTQIQHHRFWDYLCITERINKRFTLTDGCSHRFGSVSGSYWSWYWNGIRVQRAIELLSYRAIEL